VPQPFQCTDRVIAGQRKRLQTNLSNWST